MIFVSTRKNLLLGFTNPYLRFVPIGANVNGRQPKYVLCFSPPEIAGEIRHRPYDGIHFGSQPMWAGAIVTLVQFFAAVLPIPHNHILHAVFPSFPCWVALIHR